MKFKNTKITLVLLIIISTLLISGCSSNYKSSTMNSMDSITSGDYAGRGETGYPTPEMPHTESPQVEQDKVVGEVNPLEPKKVITTINLEFETSEFDKTNKNLNDILTKYNAYIESSSISNNGYYNYGNTNYRTANYVVRVPSKNVNEFKQEVVGIGNKLNESTNKQDVTSQYADTESRLKVITVKEERILSLLERAEKIEDIIALENQLSQTIQEKENLKSSLLVLDDRVDYSTFYISIQERAKLTEQETIETTFGMRVKKAFKDSMYNLKQGTQDLIISIIFVLPALIMLGIITGVILILIKKFRMKNNIYKTKSKKTRNDKTNEDNTK